MSQERVDELVPSEAKMKSGAEASSDIARWVIPADTELFALNCVSIVNRHSSGLGEVEVYILIFCFSFLYRNTKTSGEMSVKVLTQPAIWTSASGSLLVLVLLVVLRSWYLHLYVSQWNTGALRFYSSKIVSLKPNNQILKSSDPRFCIYSLIRRTKIAQLFPPPWSVQHVGQD